MMLNTERILGALQVLSRPAAAAALLGIGLLLSACGQKGPLFRPPSAANPVPADTQTVQPPKKEAEEPIKPANSL